MNHSLEPLEGMAIYAEGIDASDYVEKVASIIRQEVAEIGDLLDVGAGAGQLGTALSSSQRRWVAIEPDSYMASRLAVYPACTKVIASGWESVSELTPHSFDTVLAANMLAPQVAANQFLAFCRVFARRAIVWIVPSQRGPKKICLTGCLLSKWLPEENETGYARVMSQLSSCEYPSQTLTVDWTFTYLAKDLKQLAHHLADKLGWDKADPRRDEACHHLHQQAELHELGYILREPKQSTILIWKNN